MDLDADPDGTSRLAERGGGAGSKPRAVRSMIG